MSTEHAFDASSPQYQWLDAHLKSVDRTTTPWLVFAGHRLVFLTGISLCMDRYDSDVVYHVTSTILCKMCRPMYIDSTNKAIPDGDITVALELQKWLEPLLKVTMITLFSSCTPFFFSPHWFQQYKVDLAFWGHHHSYQRTCAVYDNICTEGATTHIVIGMAGQGLSTNIE